MGEVKLFHSTRELQDSDVVEVELQAVAMESATKAIKNIEDFRDRQIEGCRGDGLRPIWHRRSSRACCANRICLAFP